MTFIIGSYPYFLLILIEIIIFVFGKKTENKKLKNIFYIVGLLVIFLFLIFKNDSVGTDTLSYRTAFEETCKSKRMVGKKDVAFYGSMLLFSFFSQSFFLYQLIMYLIIVSLYGCFIRFTSEDIFSSLLLFVFSIVFLMALSGLRQTIAMAICSMALFIFVKGKKYYKLISIPVWLVSCFFHSSSLVFPLVFISYFFKGEFNKKQIICYLLIYFASLVLGVWFFSSIYEIKDLTYQITSVFQGIPFGSLFHLSFLIVSLYLYLRFSDLENCEKLNVKIGSWSILLYCCFLSTSIFGNVISRFGFYFAPAILVFYPTVLKNLKPIKIKFVTLKTGYSFLLIVSFLALFLYDCLLKNSLGTFPYEWRF